MSAIPRELIRWLQTLDLPFAVKAPKRDIANGYIVAEICSRYWQDVDLRQFDNGAGSKIKSANWAVLKCLFAHHDAQLPESLVADVMNMKDDAAQNFLQALYSLLTGRSITVVPAATEPEVAQVPQFNRQMGSGMHQTIVDPALQQAQLHQQQQQEESRRADEERAKAENDRQAAQRRAAEVARKSKAASTVQKVQAIRQASLEDQATDEGGSASTVQFSAVTVKALAPQALSRLGYASGARAANSQRQSTSERQYDGAPPKATGSEGVINRIASTVEQCVAELANTSWTISPGSNYLEHFALNAARLPLPLKAAIWAKLHTTSDDVASWLLGRPYEVGVLVASLFPYVSTVAVQTILGRAHYPFTSHTIDIEGSLTFVCDVLDEFAARSPLFAVDVLGRLILPLVVPSCFVRSAPTKNKPFGAQLLLAVVPKATVDMFDRYLVVAAERLTQTMLDDAEAPGSDAIGDPELHGGVLTSLELLARVSLTTQRQIAATIEAARKAAAATHVGSGSDQDDPDSLRGYLSARSRETDDDVRDPLDAPPPPAPDRPSDAVLGPRYTRLLVRRATAGLQSGSASIRLAASRVMAIAVDRGSEDELDAAQLLMLLAPIAPHAEKKKDPNEGGGTFAASDRWASAGVHHSELTAPLVLLAGALLKRCKEQLVRLSEAPPEHNGATDTRSNSLALVAHALEKIVVHCTTPSQKASPSYTPLLCNASLEAKVIIVDVACRSLSFVSSAVSPQVADQAVALLMSLPLAPRLRALSHDGGDPTAPSHYGPCQWSPSVLAGPLFRMLATGGNLFQPNGQPLASALAAPSRFGRLLDVLDAVCRVTMRPGLTMTSGGGGVGAADEEVVASWWDCLRLCPGDLLQAAMYASKSTAEATPSAEPSRGALLACGHLARRFIARCFVDLAGVPSAANLLGEVLLPPELLTPHGVYSSADGVSIGAAQLGALTSPLAPLRDGANDGEVKAMQWWRSVVVPGGAARDV